MNIKTMEMMRKPVTTTVKYTRKQIAFAFFSLVLTGAVLGVAF